MRHIKNVRAHSLDGRKAFYFELRALAKEYRYKRGWAWYKYQEKFKETPANNWSGLYADHEPISVSLPTRRWVKSRQIAWVKRKEQ